MPATEQKHIIISKQECVRRKVRRHLECALIETTAAHEMTCFKF